jgi:predicted kinase
MMSGTPTQPGDDGGAPRRPGGATRPFAVLIGGAAGTGKSTLGAALAPRLSAALLDLDVATGPLTAVVGDLLGVTDLSDPRMAGLTRGPRYDTLLALAGDNLRAGIPVVLVAPFTAERSARGWAAVADRLAPPAGDLTLVWLRLPAPELIHRLRQRGAVRDSDKTRDPGAFLATVDSGPPAVRHLALDATAPVGEMVGRVLRHLAHRQLAIDGSA